MGPTVQSAGTFTGAQIFYAANIQPSTGSDTITVTFSCPSTVTACGSSPSISQAGVVAVEYSGVDINNPLDSASAGYSTASNTTNLLDSGNVAPANSNLLIVGAGFAGATTGLAAGGPFTSHQASHGTWGSGLVEDNTTTIRGNNVLQRATASITPALTTGNWLMQMAIFRDASWTVTGAWSPARPAGVRYADQFPGTTADAKIANAMADLPLSGGIVDATALQGLQSITLSVNIAAGVTVLLGAGTFQTTACPAFSLVGTGSTLAGQQMGNPRSSSSPTILQAVSGCTGPVTQFNIGAGTKGGWIHDLTIDLNSVNTVTFGVADTMNQVEENVASNVSVGNTGAAVTAGQACFGAGSNVQNFYIEGPHCSQVYRGLDFSAGNVRNIVIDKHPRIENCLHDCFAFGDNGSVQSQDIKMYEANVETAGSSAVALGYIYNCLGCGAIGGHFKADNSLSNPSTYPTMLVLGETAVGAGNPLVEGVNFFCNYDSMHNTGVSYGIELNNVIYPTIIGNVFSDCKTKPIKNTSSTSCAVILGNGGQTGGFGLPVDNTTGICFVQGNNQPANDFTQVDQLTLGGKDCNHLGSPGDGTIQYCTDCTITNPCGCMGPGALAKRLGGVWVCN